MTERNSGRYVPDLLAVDHARLPGVRVARVPGPLPREALEAFALERGAPAAGVYRAGASPLDGLEGTSWYPVIHRPAHAGPEALLGPTVRTALPASMSIALAATLGTAATALGTAGVVGVAIGSVVTAMVARTQYTLERDQHALAGLWLAADFTRVCVARFDSLPSRLAGRARYYMVPLVTLAEPRARRTRAVEADPFVREAERGAALAHVLRALAVDGATLDPLEAERLYTLARLARFRGFSVRAQHAGSGA